jgi:TolA-binding protein
VGQSATQQNAASNIRIDVVEREIQKVKGDIDALRIGVKTGQMPGSEETGDSLGQRMAALQQRDEAIEAAQAEILEQLSKVPEKKAPAKKEKKEDKEEKESADGGISNVKELKEAYGKNRFKAVVAAAPELLKGKLKKTDKEDVVYIEAESMFKLGQVKEAALKFNELLDMNPGAEKGAQARMRMGDCFRHLGDNNTARIYYEELVQKHPKSAQAQKAKERLSKLN